MKLYDIYLAPMWGRDLRDKIPPETVEKWESNTFAGGEGNSGHRICVAWLTACRQGTSLQGLDQILR